MESSHVSFVYEENECSLVVLSTGTQDGGVYTCTARNLAGEVSCKAELAVRSGVLNAKGEGETKHLLPERCHEPRARSRTPNPSLLTHHCLPALAPHLEPPPFLLFFCLRPSACLTQSLPFFFPFPPPPPNTRHLFSSPDSHGGRGGRGGRGTARKETQ